MRRPTAFVAPAMLACALLLAACGTRAPLATQRVSLDAVQRQAQPVIVAGSTTKAQVLARFGPTTSQVFDSGNEVWLYRDGPAEWVILFGPDGVVKTTRRSVPGHFDYFNPP